METFIVGNRGKLSLNFQKTVSWNIFIFITYYIRDGGVASVEILLVMSRHFDAVNDSLQQTAAL